MKILFLDLDGTVREPISGAKFINDPSDQRLIDGVEDAIKHYAKSDWLIIGITNQCGVAAGHKSIKAAIKKQEITLSLIPQMRAIYFCPDFEGRECWRVFRHFSFKGEMLSENVSDRISVEQPFRKPGAGMIQIACETELVHINGAWMIGDRPEDEQCAAAAHINFMWADVWRDRSPNLT